MNAYSQPNQSPSENVAAQPSPEAAGATYQQIATTFEKIRESFVLCEKYEAELTTKRDQLARTREDTKQEENRFAAIATALSQRILEMESAVDTTNIALQTLVTHNKNFRQKIESNTEILRAELERLGSTNRMLYQEIQNRDRKLSAMTAQMQQLNETVAQERSTTRALKTEFQSKLTALKSQLNSTIQRANEELRARDRRQEQLQLQWNQERQQHQTNLTALAAERDQQIQLLNDEKTKRKETEAHVETLTDRIQALDRQLLSQHQENTRLEGNLKSAREETRDFAQKYEEECTRTTRLEQSNRELSAKARFAELGSEQAKEQIKKQQAAEVERNTRWKEDRSQRENTIRSLGERLAATQKENEQLSQEIEAMRKAHPLLGVLTGHNPAVESISLKLENEPMGDTTRESLVDTLTLLRSQREQLEGLLGEAETALHHCSETIETQPATEATPPPFTSSPDNTVAGTNEESNAPPSI